MPQQRRELHVQCFTCGDWFASSRVQATLDGYIPFMTNYEYTCSGCGPESIAKKPASFIQVAITTLANLTQQSTGESPPRTFFSLEEEIIPFVQEHWEAICTKRSKAASWKTNLSTKMLTETRLFREREEGCGTFALLDQDLSTIGPRRYESKTVPGGKGAGRFRRRLPEGSQLPPPPKRARGDAAPSKALSHGYPLEHPYNKGGYRYVLAEKDPHISMEVDAEDMAGRPIPSQLYRPTIATSVLLAQHDRAPQLKVGENRLTVTGDKGYCMIRSSHGVTTGSWYYEVHVDDLSSVPGSALRLGWSQALGNLQAPCGYDKLSYSWRSKFGSCFHQSRGKHYSEGYHTGDTLGFLIHLPPSRPGLPLLPKTYKDKALIKFKNFFYFEEKDEPVEEFEKTLKPLPGSKILFFKNGEPQGVGWRDVYAGTYYPALSLYKAATVTVNFGPVFQHSPRNVDWRPLSDRALEAEVEQTMAEMLFHVESRAAH